MFGKKKPNNSLRNFTSIFGGVSRTSGKKNKRFALTDGGTGFYAQLKALRDANFARQNDTFTRLAMLMGNKDGFEKDYFNTIMQMQDRNRNRITEEGNRNTVEGYASRGMTGGSAEALALARLAESNIFQGAQDHDNAVLASKNKYNEDLNTNSNLLQILANNQSQMQGQAFGGADVYNALNNTSANNFSANQAAASQGGGVIPDWARTLHQVGSQVVATAATGNPTAGQAAGQASNAYTGTINRVAG